jgi:hypothetical protein
MSGQTLYNGVRITDGAKNAPLHSDHFNGVIMVSLIRRATTIF